MIYYKIEKGIEPPRRGEVLQLLRQLKVGDSILMPLEHYARARHLAHDANRRHTGRKYAMKRVSNGYRIWRII